MEPVPDAHIPIVDAHHHLYVRNHYGDGSPYLLPEFSFDLASGHLIEATVYVECGTLRRKSGPEHLRSIGEVEFAATTGRIADEGAFGPTRVAQAIVGHVDLRLGGRLDDALLAMMEASDDRLRAIRCSATWDPDPELSPNARSYAPMGLMAEPDFREGVAALGRQGLAYDAWQFYPQLSELAALSDAVPETTFVCGHCGGLVANRGYANADNFNNWRSQIQELAKRPNVTMKLGGLANDRNGFGFRNRPAPPSVDELVRTWAPYIETCIEAFGPERCMFESNFPVDRIAASYRTLWTVFKLIAASASETEKRLLFAETARRVYKLN